MSLAWSARFATVDVCKFRKDCHKHFTIEAIPTAFYLLVTALNL